MANNTQYKGIVVKEDAKTSLKEAGVNTLRLENGMRVVALGHAYFPNHDRSLHALLLQYLRDTQPDAVILLGGMVDEGAFRSLVDEEDNYLHEFADAPEVDAARAVEGGFEEKVLALGKSCGDFIRSFADASGGKVIYIPSATHLSMGNEVRLMEYIQRKKKVLDAWSAKHPEATDAPSNPLIDLPKKLAVLFGLDSDRRVVVQRYGSAVKVNGKMLFMIGDYRRRHAGDSSKVEWEQRRCDIVRGFDGKVASGWMTTPNDTLPGLKLDFWQFHEVGYLWDATRKGEYRDYDRRAPGFWTGVSYQGEMFGQSVVFLRGTDGRRSFVVDLEDGSFKAYTEETPGALGVGEEITLLPKSQSSEAPVTPRPAAKATKSKARTRKGARRKRS
jgi:hypothetical protein